MADDHTLFRRGVRRILEGDPEIQVVGEGDNGRIAVEAVRSGAVDVVLMDVAMPVMGGVEAASIIRTLCPGTQVVMLTVSDRTDDLFGAIRAGARGYILKNATEQDLLEAVRRAHQGEAIISPALARRLLDELAGKTVPAATDASELSSREVEILHLASQGLTNKEIAEHLHLSVHTVKTHVRHVLDKLHVKNRAEAVAIAIRSGMVLGNPCE